MSEKQEKVKKVKVIETFMTNRMVDGAFVKTRYEAGQVVSLPEEMVGRLNGGVVNTNMSTPIRVLKSMAKKKNKK